MRENDGIYRAGTGRANTVNLKARLLEQPIENAPGECPVGTAARKREIDQLGLRNRRSGPHFVACL